jgi:hypothetical protein
VAIKTKYSVHDRLDEIEQETKALRVDLDNKHMKPGPAGQSIRGEKGDSIVGPAGRDGRDGKDSTVPGPVSRVPGPAGPKGVGERGPAGPDSAAVLESALAQISKIRDEFADLKLVVNAIHEQNKQADEYIAFLRAKAAAKNAG